MKIQNTFKIFFSIIIICLMILSIPVFYMLQNQFELQKDHRIRYKSLVIANELRKSSDELTRYCRTYVVTNDSIWEQRYWEVLDIRNGKRPRPDGRTIALQDSMRKLGFTKEEFDKLKEAEKNSNELVWTEKIAFNAMKGLFIDEVGNFSIRNKPNKQFSNRIMFDEKYHADKVRIMDPIDEFFELFEKRTFDKVQKTTQISYWFLGIIIWLVALIGGVAIYLFYLFKNKTLEQFGELNNFLEKAEESKQKLKESNATKDKFFSIISHDLKNPFQALLGYTSMLDESYGTFSQIEVKESISSLNNLTKKVYNLLEGLLEWSRAQTGRIVYNPTFFNLSEEASQVIQLSQANALMKNISLSIEFDTILVFADRNMVSTILRNLVMNAIKFTRGGGFVKIVAEKNNNDVIVTVLDNGIGISQEEINTLFRIDTTLTTLGTNGEQGTGVGLILCKELVQSNGGKIWVESDVEKGSKFIFTLPNSKKE